jgi:hypothetical protein
VTQVPHDFTFWNWPYEVLVTPAMGAPIHVTSIFSKWDVFIDDGELTITFFP